MLGFGDCFVHLQRSLDVPQSLLKISSALSISLGSVNQVCPVRSSPGEGRPLTGELEAAEQSSQDVASEGQAGGSLAINMFLIPAIPLLELDSFERQGGIAP